MAEFNSVKILLGPALGSFGVDVIGGFVAVEIELKLADTELVDASGFLTTELPIRYFLRLYIAARDVFTLFRRFCDI